MFEYAYNISGGDKPITKFFDVADSTALTRGELVRLTDGYIVPGGTDYTTPYIGVAAESKEANDGKLKIEIYCDPKAVFSVNPIRTIVTATPSGTVWTDSTRLLNTTADIGNGGKLKIKGKATGSTGTYGIDDIIPITDSATNTLTGVFAGNTTVGDSADFYPPIGKLGATPSATNQLTINWAATSGTALKVVGHDFAREKVLVMIALHQFAN